EVVVDLHGLRDGGDVVTEPFRGCAVPRHPPVDLRGAEGHVDRRGEQLENEPPAVPDSVRIGLDLHARLDLARTGWDEHTRPLQLDDADPANVDRSQGLE